MTIELLKSEYHGVVYYYIRDTNTSDLTCLRTELMDKFGKNSINLIQESVFSIKFHDVDDEVLFMLEYGSKFKYTPWE